MKREVVALMQVLFTTIVVGAWKLLSRIIPVPAISAPIFASPLPMLEFFLELAAPRDVDGKPHSLRALAPKLQPRAPTAA